ncbi:MAG TPA: NAD(P)-dependent alcohol dehydrogenase [Candidatus Hydrogenedentes bacterium]|nr:NAD(P)-dependent alcohol dehydrogenase [Candidatus Hydrogenedentota bacterium]HPG66091.1 NAD(P)-dependent alcohol dehydrogenase [Candidatus Hydrogenedentota bacterium]
MKAVLWFGPRDLRLVEVDKPTPRAHEALIRIESVGLCGSDLHYYEEGRIGNAIIRDPLILGHEYAGTVEAVGETADASLVGKRVAVEPGIPCGVCESCRTGHYNVCPDMVFPGGPPHQGALCEYMAVHSGYCFPVPEGMNPAAAALIEPVAVAVHTVELARLRPGETVAVLGLGPIGLLIAQVARFSGAGRIFGTDLLDYRIEAGRRCGIDVAVNARRVDTVAALLEATNGRGVDVAIDAARSSDTPALACRVVRPAGRCVLTGISGQECDPFPVNVARRKELQIQWCRRFRHDFPRAIDLVASGKVDLSLIITHSFGLEQTPEAFELVSRAQDNVLKVSIDL